MTIGVGMDGRLGSNINDDYGDTVNCIEEKKRKD